MRVVLDANVMASGAIGRPGSPLTELVGRWFVGEFTVVVSDDLRAEVVRTLEKPYFAARLSIFERRHFLTLLDQRSERVTPTVRVDGVATHPEDDRVLEAAVSAGVDCLVTGDRALQRLGSFERIPILAPRSFLEALRDPTGSTAPAG